MINDEIKEKLVVFYGGVKAAVRKNMRFEEKNGRVRGRYTDDVPISQNGGYFYEGIVSCLPDGTDIKWEIPHHYSKYD